MSEATETLLPRAGVSWITGRRALTEAAPLWRDCLATHPDRTLFDEPDYLLEHHSERLETLRLAVVRRAGRAVAAVPFIRERAPLRCQIGEIALARLPTVRYRLLGSGLRAPAEPDVLAALVDALRRTGEVVDLVSLHGITTGSALESGLLATLKAQEQFDVYPPEPPKEQVYIDFEGRFDAYFKSLSRRARRHHAAKKLKTRGEVTFTRVTEPGEVDGFVDAACAVSRRSWQYHLLGNGIRRPAALKEKLREIARRGLLRAYLLTCGGAPVAYKINYQDDRALHSVDIAYDQDFARYSAGIVLVLWMIEDLFAHRTPGRFEFGVVHDYKTLFTTGSRRESAFWLVRRLPYPQFVSASHRGAALVADALTRVANRFGVKERIRTAIRRRSLRK